MIEVGSIHWDSQYNAYFQVQEATRPYPSCPDVVLIVVTKWNDTNSKWCGRYSCDEYYVNVICRPVRRLEALVVLGVKI